MNTKTKDVYYCDHCGKHGLSKHAMLYHEKICHKNPDNKRPCFDICKHLEKRETTIFYETYYGATHEMKVDAFYCTAKKTFLYTPQNKVKGNMFEMGDESNEEMPLICDCYQPLSQVLI